MRLVFLLLFLVGCPLPPEPNPPPNPVPVDGGSYDCNTACQHLDSLGCELAKPTAEGATCVQVCENNAIGPVTWDVGCLSMASDCEACDG